MYLYFGPSSVLFGNFVKFQDQFFHIQKVHIWIYITDLFSVNLIYFDFNIYYNFLHPLHYLLHPYFWKMCFLAYCLLKFKSFLSTFRSNIFWRKNAAKFILSNTANSKRVTTTLYTRITQAADWNIILSIQC